MKKIRILTLFIFFVFNTVSAQKNVPSWIKNALPITQKNINKIEKRGKTYLEKYKNAEEGSLEKNIFYRIKYINYLKELLELNTKIASIDDGDKPFPFKIFVNGGSYAYLKELPNNKKLLKIELENEIKIDRDTILKVVDIFSNSHFVDEIGYLPHQINDVDNHYKIIVDYAGKKYQLKNSYDYYTINSFPNFEKWKEKYYAYSKKYNDSIEKFIKEKAIKNTLVKDNIRKSNNLESKRIKCTTKVDEFTGKEITTTNQKRLIVIENEVLKEKANELSNKGIYVDYETFVFAVKGIRKGKKIMLDIYTKHKTTDPLLYYGIMVKNSFIDFKLENGEVLNLQLLNTNSPEVNFKYKYSYYENTLVLTQSDISKLKQYPVIKIRINYSKGYKDYDVNVGYNSIEQIINCLD